MIIPALEQNGVKQKWVISDRNGRGRETEQLNSIKFPVQVPDSHSLILTANLSLKHKLKLILGWAFVIFRQKNPNPHNFTSYSILTIVSLEF